MGRALVNRLCMSGDSVLAISRDRKDLEAIRGDCLVRYGATVHILAADVAEPGFDPQELVARCIAVLGTVSNVFLPIGSVHEKDLDVPPAGVLESLTDVNYLRPAQLIGAFCEYFVSAGQGRIMVFSSIAAAAPRSSNAAYASAKAALEFYCRALQHRFADSQIQIQICALGYVDTSMSFGRKLLFPVATAAEVASFALMMSRKRTRFFYYPRFWRVVVTILKMTPWPIYKRLRF